MRYFVAFLALAIISFVLFNFFHYKFNQPNDFSNYLISEPNISKNQIIAEIDNEKVYREEVDFEYKILTNTILYDEDLAPVPDYGASIHSELSVLKEKIVMSLIERKLLYNFIKRDTTFTINDPNRTKICIEHWKKYIEKSDAKVINNEKSKAYLKKRLCEQDLLSQYLNEKIYSKIKLSDEEMLDYFKHHPKEFISPPKVTIRQIVLADEKTAKKLKNMVTSRNFTKLAKKYSITPEAEDGGILGPFTIGFGMPRFFEVAFNMKPGQISDILKSTYGFHIIMLEEKVPQANLSFLDAKNHIRQKLYELTKERKYKQWVDQALHTMDVKSQVIY